MSPRLDSVSRSVLGGLLLVTAVALQAANGNLRGQITDPQGKAIPNANVSAVQFLGSQIQETRSDSDGRYAFPFLPAGAYKLVAVASSFSDVHRTVNVPDGGALVINLQFERLVS